jgi:hypothetical protein
MSTAPSRTTPRRIRLGVVRGISYGLFAKPDPFMDAARSVGAGLVRVYVYWSQVEPERGRYDWSVADAILAEADDDADLWITVCSSSMWGTRTPTDFQPPSPAVDEEAYTAFVAALVRHCGGRVRYWQCDNEPSNTGLLWAGTAGEYAHQLHLFAAAVRASGPGAYVVLGGCGYDMFASPGGSPQRAFYDEVAGAGRDDFDLFSVNLYDDPHRTPEHIETARAVMRAHGYERPVVVGEYNGPTLFQFPAATAALEHTMMAAFAAAASGEPVSMSTAELAEQAAAETPDRRALRDLYARRAEVPPELGMFMAGAPAELAERRERLACRQLTQRALLALASGADALACWNLAPEVPDYTDPYNIMDLMFGTLALMDYADGAIRTPRPAARAHRLLAAVVAGACDVRTVAVPDEPDVMAVRIDTGEGAAARMAVWLRREDPLDEPAEPRPITLPWPHAEVHAVDAYGEPVRVAHADGRVGVGVTPVPVVLSATPVG